MNCQDIKQKILSNLALEKEEQEHLTICSDCHEVYIFNRGLGKMLQDYLKYPECNIPIPEALAESPSRSWIALLKPALSYAFILVLGITLGYITGSLSYRKDHIKEEKIQKGNTQENHAISNSDIAPISKDVKKPKEDIYLAPLSENLKEELGLKSGVIVIETEPIKKLLEKCKETAEIDCDLNPNDIILEVNNTPIDNEALFRKIVEQNCKEIIVKIIRDGKIYKKVLLKKKR